MKVTIALQWATHKDKMESWWTCIPLLQIRFRLDEGDIKLGYVGLNLPTTHLKGSIKTLNKKKIPRDEWVHLFVHMLDIIPRNQYIELEVRRGKMDWGEMTHNFKVTFIFESGDDLVDKAL